MDIAEHEEHPTDEQLGINPVKQVCPVCGLVWYIDSLEKALAEIEELWKPWQRFMTEEQKQTVRQHNNLERLRKILDKQGYIKIFCLKCQIAATARILTGTLMDNETK